MFFRTDAPVSNVKQDRRARASHLARLVFATASLGAGAAVAQPISGFYATGAGGANFAGSIVSLSGNTNIQTKAGPVGVLGLGYGFANGLRVEIEGDYRSNAVSNILTRRVNGRLMPMYNVGGGPTAYGFMANALYDLPLGGFNLPFRPYVGGGIGYSRVDFSNVTGTEPFNFPVTGNPNLFYPGTGIRTMGSAGAFAYQAIAGAAVPITSIPGLEMTLEYRYFATTRVTIPITTHSPTTIPFNNVPSSTSNITQVLARDSAVMLGFRYVFAKPAI